MDKTDFKSVMWKKILPVGLMSWSLLGLTLTEATTLKAAESVRTEIVQQKSKITGTVVDSSGEPLIGVNVTVKGTTNGTISDMLGNFTINESRTVTLVFSYIGNKTKTIQAKPGEILKVVMEDDSQMLEEVVAIGYGTIKRKDMTGSVGSVGNQELVAVPVASPVEAMQGKLAGVRVTTPEGNPDAEVIIRVRGGGSITRDNTPLYIVDGFPVSSISDIPTADIESIDVLKDASSTAIYGSRGSNGIVLVTTKSGKAGKVTVNFNAYVGMKKAATKIHTLSTEDYLNWSYENLALQGKADLFTNTIGTWTQIPTLSEELETTDWQDEVYGRTGNTFSQNLSVSGGTEKLRFNFGYGHMNEKAILLTSRFKRDNLSLKLNYEPNKKTQLEFSSRYSRTQVFGDGQSDATGDSNSTPSGSFGRIRHSIIQTPLTLDGTGDIVLDDNNIDSGLEDPVTALNDNYKERTRQIFNMNGSFTWKIIKNLTFRTDVGLDIYDNKLKYFYGTTTYESQNNTQADYKNMPVTQNTSVMRRTFRNTNTLTYDFKNLLPKDHNLNLMVGQEVVSIKENKITARVEGFPTFYDAGMAFDFSAQGTPTKYDDFYYPDDNIVSFFGRANYDYKGRYLLSGTLRADGSSKFAEGNRWGYFPSIAAGWRITEEAWMESTKKWLSNLKLRFSYGISGNNNIPSGQTTKTYAMTQSSWLNIASSYLSAGTSLNNANLKWETTHSFNVGLDFGFFSNKLNGSVEVYKNNVKNLLMEMQVAGCGYNTQYQNVGETQNSGYEFTLNYTAVNKKDYVLDFSLTLGHNVNEVKSLGGMEFYTKASYWASTEVGNDYIIAPGLPVGSMYGYITDGRYEVTDFTGYENGKWILKEGVADDSGVVGTVRPGTLKLKNMTEGDHVINDEDKSVIGDANAWAVGGFTVNGRVKGFDLSANFTYSIGNDIYNADKIDQTSTRASSWRNMSDVMAAGKRWTNVDANGNLVNDAATLASLNATTTMWSPYTTKAVIHSWAIEDGSFLRLANLTLGYTLPKSLTRKAFIENLRFYATASNLFCLTNYSGADPEVDCKRNYLICPGVDYSAYPKSRQYIFGVNLTF
ncbi:TonB-dependent receptor [uncultured Bacteroides sp.]|uniref:SusC/RagA family TonB-linked outer membrane protein n=1 Tax=uncultured Bacteroides sp. TaxID=162156 RepID=UPI00280C3148|nr:TonB-dependent receptor [uncultured Bacteroides sp.]